MNNPKFRLSVIGLFPPLVGGLVELSEAMASNMEKEGHIVLRINVGLGFISYLVLPWLYIRYLLAIARSDVVLLISGSGSALSLKMLPAVLIARVMGKKCFMQFAGGAAVTNASSWRLPKKLVFRLLHAVIVPTEPIKEALVRHGIQAKYRVIPHIVNVELFENKQKNLENHTLIAVKGLSSFSGHELLIDVFTLVKKRIPDVQLEILGDGPPRNHLEELVRQRKLEGIHFRGNIPHNKVPKLIQNADIFVHCSRYESFGIALVEAMAAGLPVVAFSVGGIPEVVPDKKAGFLLPYGDIQSFADRIIQLLADSQKYTEISKCARNHSKRFSWNSLRNEWLDLYGISES